MRLEGVPFGYLVATPQMLPPESLRRFEVERRWIESLVDGAFLVGSLGGAQCAHHEQAMRAELHARIPRFGGFLLRSAMVSGWPELRVAVSAKGRAVEPIVRRLSRDTLLCLFDGGADRVEAFLANLPDFVVMAAADEAELVHMVATAARIDDRPSAFRYPRGEGVGIDLPLHGTPLEIGKGRIIRDGGRVALLSFGTRLAEATKAAEALAQRGIPTTVADARFAKPLDQDLVLNLARNHEALITIEEGAIGGFGSHVAQCLAENGIFDRGLRFRSMVLPDIFIDQASPKTMYDTAGMNAAQIEAKALAALGIATVGTLRA